MTEDPRARVEAICLALPEATRQGGQQLLVAPKRLAALASPSPPGSGWYGDKPHRIGGPGPPHSINALVRAKPSPHRGGCGGLGPPALMG
jgi:hypothetical protein